MIDNEIQPLTFVLNEGETVSVTAFLGPTAPPGFTITTRRPIEGALVVGGQDVVPQGTTQGDESFAFTYTVR